MTNHISLLVIDDDTHICSLLEVISKPFEITFSAVNSLEAAKKELEFFIPTFVFLDNSLPDGKGTDFINYLNTNFPCIKIILCTADMDISFNSQKVYLIIKKPFMIDEIRDAIRSIFQLPGCAKKEICFSHNCSRIVI